MCRILKEFVKGNFAKGANEMKRGLYRKLKKGKCTGCDHPQYAPSKNVNPERACVKCWKEATKRKRKYEVEYD